jgi:hypothetical protein
MKINEVMKKEFPSFYKKGSFNIVTGEILKTNFLSEFIDNRTLFLGNDLLVSCLPYKIYKFPLFRAINVANVSQAEDFISMKQESKEFIENIITKASMSNLFDKLLIQNLDFFKYVNIDFDIFINKKWVTIASCKQCILDYLIKATTKVEIDSIKSIISISNKLKYNMYIYEYDYTKNEFDIKDK